MTIVTPFSFLSASLPNTDMYTSSHKRDRDRLIQSRSWRLRYHFYQARLYFSNNFVADNDSRSSRILGAVPSSSAGGTRRG